MSGIYFDHDVRLKKYAATTTSGAKKVTSVVRIELVTADPYALASVLRQLEEIETEQRVADAVARHPPRPRRRGPSKITAPAPLLMLPYRGDEN